MSAPSLIGALEQAVVTLESHPGYDPDVTFKVIWQWLAAREGALVAARAALKAAQS